MRATMASAANPPKTPIRKDTIFSRRQIENLIAEGRSIVIVDGRVLKIDAFQDYHPGGDKVIKHMIGRDATDEVNALHSQEARRYMTKFQIGRIEGRWTNFLPPIQGGSFNVYPVNLEPDQVEANDDSSSSDGESSPGTPLFDPVEDIDGCLRRRSGNTLDLDETSSVSSFSSIELPAGNKPSKLSHIDALTKQELDFDLAKYPTLDSSTQDHIVEQYRLLYDRLRAEHLFDCNYRAYAIETCRYTMLFALFLLFLRWGWYGTSGLFLSMCWHQLVFTVHDAGHMGITHDFTVDTVIGIIIADFIGGLSIGWWKRSHNVHHIVTNSPEHDPDIEHMPFFAVSHRFFESLKSTYYDRIMIYDPFAKFLVRYQHCLYYPILLFGRFNLYRLSWVHLILGQGPRKGAAWWHRWLEITGHVFFWYWFGYQVVYKSIPTAAGRWAFILVSHMVSGVLHLQITLSHFGMSTADMGTNESFPQKMMRTTMDVDCPEWLDFFHGGLQFQAIHHLFPRMPRHNLRQAQKLVQEFCRQVEIPYALFGFVDGNKEVIGKLGDVARQATILAQCQRTIAATGDFGNH